MWRRAGSISATNSFGQMFSGPRGRGVRVFAYLCLGSMLASFVMLLLLDAWTPVDPPLPEPILYGRIDSEEQEREWLAVMRDAPIVNVRLYDKGLAAKYQLIFESGHIVAAKPIYPETLFSSEIPIKNFTKLHRYERRTVFRAEWLYQGWSEIAGYHVDKLLGFNRKPPIVGRMISNKILYKWDSSWYGFYKRWSPEHPVLMALVPWIDDLQRAVPTVLMRDMLTLENPSLPGHVSAQKQLGDVSDKLVFDFMVDDHDTQGAQNWKADMTGQLLHWDTGLGWQHGPYPVSACYDVLCGTKEWKGVAHTAPNPKNCTKICSFRKSTIERLKGIYENGEKDRRKHIGYLLREALKSDPLTPIFHMGMYRYSEFSKKLNDYTGEAYVIRFSADSFHQGMQHRLKALFQHVDLCIAEYGEEKVLRDY